MEFQYKIKCDCKVMDILVQSPDFRPLNSKQNKYLEKAYVLFEIYKKFINNLMTFAVLYFNCLIEFLTLSLRLNIQKIIFLEATMTIFKQ